MTDPNTLNTVTVEDTDQSDSQQYEDHSYTIQVGEQVEVVGAPGVYSVQEEGPTVIEVQVDEDGQVVNVLNTGTPIVSPAPVKRSGSTTPNDDTKRLKTGQANYVDLPRTHDDLPLQVGGANWDENSTLPAVNEMYQSRFDGNKFLSPPVVKIIRQIPMEDVPYNVVHEDLMRVLTTEEHRISVRIMRKVLPALRIVTHYRTPEFVGKKKIKGLWNHRPEDWPPYIPHKDPNNGEKGADGKAPIPKANSHDLKLMYKHLKEIFIKLLEQQVEQMGQDEIAQTEQEINMEDVRQQIMARAASLQTPNKGPGVHAANGVSPSVAGGVQQGYFLPTLLEGMHEEEDVVKRLVYEKQKEMERAWREANSGNSGSSSKDGSGDRTIAAAKLNDEGNITMAFTSSPSIVKPEVIVLPPHAATSLMHDDHPQREETAQALLRLSGGPAATRASPTPVGVIQPQSSSEGKTMTPLTTLNLSDLTGSPSSSQPVTVYVGDRPGGGISFQQVIAKEVPAGGYSIGSSNVPTSVSVSVLNALQGTSAAQASPNQHLAGLLQSLRTIRPKQDEPRVVTVGNGGGGMQIRSPATARPATPIVINPISSSGSLDAISPTSQSSGLKSALNMKTTLLDDLHKRLKEKIMYLMNVTLGDSEVNGKLNDLYKDVRDLYHQATAIPDFVEKFIQISHETETMLDLFMVTGGSFPREKFLTMCSKILSSIDHSDTKMNYPHVVMQRVALPEHPPVQSPVYQHLTLPTKHTDISAAPVRLPSCSGEAKNTLIPDEEAENVLNQDELISTGEDMDTDNGNVSEEAENTPYLLGKAKNSPEVTIHQNESLPSPSKVPTSPSSNLGSQLSDLNVTSPAVSQSSNFIDLGIREHSCNSNGSSMDEIIEKRSVTHDPTDPQSKTSKLLVTYESQDDGSILVRLPVLSGGKEMEVRVNVPKEGEEAQTKTLPTVEELPWEIDCAGLMDDLQVLEDELKQDVINKIKAQVETEFQRWMESYHHEKDKVMSALIQDSHATEADLDNFISDQVLSLDEEFEEGVSGITPSPQEIIVEELCIGSECPVIVQDGGDYVNVNLSAYETSYDKPTSNCEHVQVDSTCCEGGFHDDQEVGFVTEVVTLEEGESGGEEEERDDVPSTVIAIERAENYEAVYHRELRKRKHFQS